MRRRSILSALLGLGASCVARPARAATTFIQNAFRVPSAPAAGAPFSLVVNIGAKPSTTVNSAGFWTRDSSGATVAYANRPSLQIPSTGVTIRQDNITLPAGNYTSVPCVRVASTGSYTEVGARKSFTVAAGGQSSGPPSTGMRGWWKADAITSPPADGANLATWNNSSGTAPSATQATAANQPTYRTSGAFLPNGKPCVEFFAATPRGMTIGSGRAGASTTFVMVRFKTLGAEQRPYSASSGPEQWIDTSGVQQADVPNVANLNMTPSGGALVVDTWYVMALDTDGSASHHQFRNGVATGSSTSGAVSSASSWGIGARTWNGFQYPLDGYIAEFIDYNRVLSAAERNQVTDYLTAKYVSAPSAAQTVTVDATSNTGTWTVAISFNHFWLDGATDPGFSRWSAYNPPAVRIPVHNYPTGGMPKIGTAAWDFSTLDSLITVDRQDSQAAPMVCISDWPTAIANAYDTAGATALGQFFARIVSYYNTGSMTTGMGTTITNPNGVANKITYWEILNEPSIASGSGLMTPTQYANMFNIVAPLMKAVDPTIKLLGPVDNEENAPYVSSVMAIANPPDIISHHHYGGPGSNSDNTLLATLAPSTGTIWKQLAQNQAAAGTKRHWMTEANLIYDSNDPYGRMPGALGQVWNAELFRISAQFGVDMMQNWNWSEDPFWLVDRTNGNTTLSYWRNVLLNRYFPVGQTTLTTTTTLATGITCMAARKADGTVHLLLINKRVQNLTVNGGTGVASDVTITITNKTPTAVTVQKIDSTTSPASEPAVVTLSTSNPVVSFPGYGIAFVKIT